MRRVELNHQSHPLEFLPRLLLLPVLLALLVFVAILVVREHGSATKGATVVGSGREVTQTRGVAPFTAVTLAGDVAVDVHEGAVQRVRVRADDNLIGKVTTRVARGELVVGTTGSFSTKAPMHVTLTVHALSSLVLSGDGVLTAVGVQADRLRVSLPGNGLVHVTGSARILSVELAGNGDAELGGLEARDASVRLSGTGRVVVRATGNLAASVSGTGAVVYLGTPKQLVTEVTGLGTINQG